LLRTAPQREANVGTGTLAMAVRVQREDFDSGAEVRLLTSGRADVGAVVTFTGLVRGEAHDSGDARHSSDARRRPLASMTLEHYPGMTEAELGRVEAEARARFDLIDSLIVHRYGELAPGENIVLVVTLSAHRQAAFDAASFLMDYLKTRAPFWKKETGVDGAGDWVDAREGDEVARQRWGRADEPTV